MMFVYDRGIRLTSAALWLDASRKVPACCVSHAHLDHARKHGMVIATKTTLALMQARIGVGASITLSYKQPFDYDGLVITLYPAGHILGSAQVLIETNGTRLLYSGDFNTCASATAEAIEVPECDVLIMESTFGKPLYRFPGRDQVTNRLLDFVHLALAQNSTPVVLAYTLGKSHEAMKILAEAGFKLSVHGSIAALAKIYEQNGVDFGDWAKFNDKDLTGRVVIFPRHALDNRRLKKIPEKRTVFLSGWAVNPRLKHRYGVDEALPLSDHADFDGLIEYVRRARPRQVYTTHGFAEFPRHLRAIGFRAELLSKMVPLPSLGNET
jgi:putative mRNA 3-end processing factor